MERRHDTTFVGQIPPQAAGEKIFFYVAARNESEKTVTFEPSSAEFNPLSIRINPGVATSSPLFINEVMASNTKTITDEEGKFEDWIELRNTHPEPIDLTGYSLSDNPKNPKKWTFPEGTIIQGQSLLIIWADEDHKTAKNGIHANFKLAKKGESIALYDRDEHRNQRLDEVTYKDLSDDQSWGRPHADVTQFQILEPSPGEMNP